VPSQAIQRREITAAEIGQVRVERGQRVICAELLAERRYPPNRLLAWERLQRGWSYEELAHRVRAEMADCGEGDTGLTANTVRRWETGDRWPEPRFRKHLVVIFGKPASELGFLTPDELATRPVSTAVTEIRRLVAMAEDEIRTAGLDRAAFLRGLLGIGALPIVTRLTGGEDYEQIAAGTSQGRGSDAGSAQAYSRIIAAQRELYWTSPAADLFESAYANAQLGIRLLRATADSQARAILSIALAESAMLAGRLAFFDLHQPAVAQRCYEAAFGASREAGDHALAAAVLGHMAFIPAFASDTARSLELIDAAQQHCWYGVTPLVRSWLHCVAAEAMAHSTEPTGYRHRIDLAEEAVTTGPEVPAWFDYYDASRLNGFAGYCALAAGDAQTASAKLHLALNDLAPAAAKQRTVLLADLATAHLDGPAHAAAFVDQALDVLTSEWYATGHQRIGHVIDQLPAGADEGHLRERYRAVTPVALPGVW
jgi:transcriptional regulator with XRE-family HTH domain